MYLNDGLLYNSYYRIFVGLLLLAILRSQINQTLHTYPRKLNSSSHWPYIKANKDQVGRILHNISYTFV